MAIATKWPVVVTIELGTGDADDAGLLTDAGLDRVFGEASAAYFGRCATVDAGAVRVLGRSLRRREAAVGEMVTASIAAVELYPDSMSMDLRVRPAEGDGIAAEARFSVSPGGEITTAMRDEFIAMAHAAAHFH